jgi:hypothetical protein
MSVEQLDELGEVGERPGQAVDLKLGMFESSRTRR